MSEAPERQFLQACHPDSFNENCSWTVVKSPENAIAYIREDLLATRLKEAREALWGEVLRIANNHLEEPGFGYLLRNKLTEAAALERAAADKEK